MKSDIFKFAIWINEHHFFSRGNGLWITEFNPKYIGEIYELDELYELSLKEPIECI